MLNDVDRVALIEEFGYDKYSALVGQSKSFRLVGDVLFKVVGDVMKEVPSFRRRKQILAEIHNVGGHVGIMKLYHMVRSMYYWPGLIEDCVAVVDQCVDCKKSKEKPNVLPLKPTHKFDKPF